MEWSILKSFRLDASCSSDPDFNGKDLLTYEFYCSRSCEQQPKFTQNMEFIPWSASNPYSYSGCNDNGGRFQFKNFHISGPLNNYSKEFWHNPAFPLIDLTLSTINQVKLIKLLNVLLILLKVINMVHDLGAYRQRNFKGDVAAQI